MCCDSGHNYTASAKKEKQLGGRGNLRGLKNPRDFLFWSFPYNFRNQSSQLKWHSLISPRTFMCCDSGHNYTASATKEKQLGGRGNLRGLKNPRDFLFPK